MTTKSSAAELAARAEREGWELVAASKIGDRLFATTAGLAADAVYRFNWPKSRNGTGYDQAVYAFLYVDGSCTVTFA